MKCSEVFSPQAWMTITYGENHCLHARYLRPMLACDQSHEKAW